MTSIANPAAAVTLLGVSLNGQTCATIYGTGFSSTPSQNTVTFNGAAATVDFSTPTTIRRVHLGLVLFASVQRAGECDIAERLG